MRIRGYQHMRVLVGVKDVPRYAIAQSHGEIADISELAEIDDGGGLVVLADWIGFDEGEHA